MNSLKYRAFPEFYREYAPKLIEFFGAWVEWLNEEGNSSYIVDHLSTEHDIDESVNAYSSHLKYKLLSDFPDFLASDLKLLLKNIFYLYNSKSSIQAYEFLFRCLFNSPAEITYPKDFMLKTSDGRWSFPYYLQTDGYEILEHLDIYNWFKIEGSDSGAIAYIDGADVFKSESGSYENCLRIVSVTGTFIKGEHLILTNPENGEIINFDDFTVKEYLMDYQNGKWSDTKGLLDSDMVIQDSYYYQDFSYIIKSNVSMNKWSALVKSILHPAGLEFFGELSLGGDDNDNQTKVIPINPIGFLAQWHLVFKLYSLSLNIGIESVAWTYGLERIAQVTSETLDNWIYFGRYHENDGFWNMNVGYTTSFANRNSVIMFRDNGTLINPDIIRWGVFEFSKDVETQTLKFTTLHPEKSLCYGTISGNEWKPEYEESIIPERYMVFITQTNDESSKIIKDLISYDEYKRVVNDEETVDTQIRDTTINDIAVIPIDDKEYWKKLTINDYITKSLDVEEFFDENSFLKIPDDYIRYDDEEKKYIFPKRHYNNEKIVIFNYGKNDISEHFFYENVTSEKNHVFTMRGSTSKDYILCFIDGKFSNEFKVNEREIIIPDNNYRYVEVYVLAPIEANRKMVEWYCGDKHFVYHNVRKWPYAPYNTHITKFSIADYPKDGYVIKEHPDFKISKLCTVGILEAINHKDYVKKMFSAAQVHSETLDEWIARGQYYSNEGLFNRVVNDINKIGNRNSTLVFSEYGELIPPDNIVWWQKRIKYNGDSIDGVFLGDDSYDEYEFIKSDENNAYGKFLYALPILSESSAIHFHIDDSNVWESSSRNFDDNDFIDKNYFAFINGKKIKDGSIKANKDTKTYTFSTNITGDVYIFNYSSFYKKNYYIVENANSIKLKEKDILDTRYIIVFEDGLLSHNWVYKDGTITLKKVPTDCAEVYILNSYSYFAEDKAKFNDKDMNFTFNNLRKMNVMSSMTWLKKLTELETSAIAFEDNDRNIRKALAVLQNNIAQMKSEFNIHTHNAPEVIPQYDTFDRLLYDGTYDIKNFEEIPVSFLEKELNKYSTMLFTENGLLINPNNITWSLIRNEIPVITNSLRPVVLNSNMPAVIGEIVTNDIYGKKISETMTKESALIDLINTEVINELSASDSLLQSTSNDITKHISELAAENYMYYSSDSSEEIPHFIPLEDDFIDKDILVFINGKKVYIDDYYIENGTYYFNNISNYDGYISRKMRIQDLNETINVFNNKCELQLLYNTSNESNLLDENFESVVMKNLCDEDYLYVNYKPSLKEVVVFQYNPDDLETIMNQRNSTNRFFKLPRVGFMPQNLLVFKNGFLTDDYYISGDTVSFSKVSYNDFIEIYAFKEYDYLFVNENKYNKRCKEFTVTNIKRSKYF